MSDSDKDTSSNWTPPSVAELQAMLPLYEVNALWGRGGMGAVYRGRQKSLHRDVAIKVLPENFAVGGPDSDPHQFVERFKLEARSMANLDHPAILSVYDFGQTENGQLYLVMEFIDGMDIYAYLQHHGGKLPDKHAIAICSHVLDALQYAHDSGVIHRDIKPSNVLINSQGRVKLADFGLAKRIAEEGENGEDSGAPLTMPDMAMGTPDFVAPESLESERNVDGRADLYAVGVMLYQLLTGKLPRGQFKMPSEMMPGLDVRFDEVVSKALQADPDDRYASATAFRGDLDKILSQPIPQAEDPQSSAIPLAKLAEAAAPASKAKPETSKPEPPESEKSKAPLWIGMGLATVVVIGTVIYFMTRPGADTRVGTDVPAVGEEPAASKPESGPKENLVASTETADGQGRPSLPVDPVDPPKAPEPATPVIANEPAAPKTGEAGAGTGVPAVREKGKTPEPATPAPPPIPSTPPIPEESSMPEPEPEPAIEAAQLAAIPGLKTRLDTYLNARRTAVEELAAGYLKGLDTRMNQAADAGDLKLTKAFRGEKTLVEDLQKALAEKFADPVEAVGQSATLPPLAGDAPEGLVSLRKVWQTERQKIRTDLDGKLQQSLKALESELTKARELERAEIVLGYREGLNGKATATVAETPESAKTTTPPPAVVPNQAMASQSATKEKPFENSLGMRFVPVPIIGGPSDGKLILFSIWETRVQDYEEFIEDNQKREWPEPVFEQDHDHPAVNVHWEDAAGFCDWLTERDQKKRKIGAEEVYRLPTDHEWSCAAGLGEMEDASASPKSKNHMIASFPWGEAWPPPEGTGNFYGEECIGNLYDGNEPSKGYNDGFPRTSPVAAFQPNRFGLFDLSGNVSELCSDWYDVTTKQGRVTRGRHWAGSFSSQTTFFSSARGEQSQFSRWTGIGFRVVLDTGVPAPAAPTSVTQTPAAPQIDRNALKLASKERPFVNSLGMKFVPVPGTDVLFCIHEARRKDYAAHAAESDAAGKNWERPWSNEIEVIQSDDHSVTAISWEDSNSFCDWLSRKEGVAYRLPTDREWSIAVGIGRDEKRGAAPAELSGKVADEYPWGREWPPPKGAGNYADTASRERDPSIRIVDGYTDGFSATAPVMSFSPNNLGLFDMSGNLWEWCEDWQDPVRKRYRVARGGGWETSIQSSLLSSARAGNTPTNRGHAVYGFRVVIDPNAEVPATPQAAAKPTWSPAVILAALEKKPGRLFGFGNLPGGMPVSIAIGSKFDDFVSVHVFSGGWIGLRGNGDVVTAQEAKVEGFPRGITKLGHSPYRDLQSGIDRNGNLKFATLANSQLLDKEPRNIRGVSDIWTSPPGPNHLVLLADGTVKYWGAAYDAPGATNPPPEALAGVKAIAASSNTNQCFVAKNDGSVIGWTPGGGRIAVPESIRDVEELAAGNNCFFALTEAGKILFWGSKSYGVDQVPDGLEECVAIRADRCTAAAQKKDGSWVAWGNTPGGIVEKINSLGPVSDIAFQSSTSPPSPGQTGYVFWIKADVE